MTGMLLAKPIGKVSDMTRHETSQTLVCVYRRRLCIRRKHIMTIKLKDKLFTEEEIIKCLATCESVISKNAYLEKKWGNCYYHFFDVSSSELYKEKRLEWMEYRKKLRSLLLNEYSMKEIIKMTKACKDKYTQKMVMSVIDLMS